jgi:hypothetical protein
MFCHDHLPFSAAIFSMDSLDETNTWKFPFLSIVALPRPTPSTTMPETFTEYFFSFVGAPDGSSA